MTSEDSNLERIMGVERALTLFRTDIGARLDRQLLSLRQIIQARLDGNDKQVVGVMDQVEHLRDLVVSEFARLRLPS